MAIGETEQVRKNKAEALDATEPMRRNMIDEINAVQGTREALIAEYGGRVWSTEEMQAEFTVTGFMAPVVVVIRKADGQKGSLLFRHSPRLYFKFEPHIDD